MKGNMMNSWAKVGAKVVCIDDKWAPNMGMPLEKGSIYTVIEVFSWGAIIKIIGVVLQEAKSDHPTKGYQIRRFSPIVSKTQEQDIAMFKSILTDTRIPEKV